MPDPSSFVADSGTPVLKSFAPDAPLASQMIPTPEQADADTTRVAQAVVPAMIHGPTIGAPAQTPWYAQSFDDSGMPTGTSLLDGLSHLWNAFTGEGTATGQAIRQQHPQIGHALGLEGKQPDYRDQPRQPLDLPLFDARALNLEGLVPGNGTGSKIARGAIEGAESFAGGMTTPRNAEILTATGGIGKGAPLMGRLISAGFATKMLVDAYRQIPEFKKAVKAGDFEAASQIATSISLGGVTAYLAGRHAVKGGGAANEPEPARIHSEAPTSPLGLSSFIPDKEETTKNENTEKPAEAEAKSESAGETAGEPAAGARPGVGGSAEAEEPRELLNEQQEKSAQTPEYEPPDIAAARERMGRIPPTHDIDTPERRTLRQNIADRLYRTEGVDHEKQAYLVIGPPAAGKSTISEPLARERRALLVDADDAKKLLPEYGTGEGAAAVHEESSDIAGDLIERATADGLNIVHPIVGKNLEKVRRMRDELRAEGYDVHLVHVDLPPEKAAARAIERYRKTGRFVDPRYVMDQVGDAPKQNYDRLKSEGGFKSYARYSTDVPRGEQPRLVESSDFNALHLGDGARGRGAGDGSPLRQTGSPPEGPPAGRGPAGPETSGVAPGADDTSEPEQSSGFLGKLDKAGRESDEWLRKNGGAYNSNRFVDPQVIYHMTRAIAGDVARGVITLRDAAQQIYDRVRNRFPDLSLDDITQQIAGHIAEAHGRGPVTMGSGLGALQPVYERAARSLNESAEEMKALRQKRDEALAALKASESTPQEKEHGRVLRRFFTGERDMWGVRVNQAIERLRKIVPDPLEQEALSLMRDFKDRPGELEAFMKGTHPDLTRMSPDDYDQAMKNLEPLLPVMQRALSPTPRMLVADRVLTDIADKTLAEGQRLGILGGNVTDALHSLATLMPRKLFADPDVVQALAKGRFRTRQELNGFIDRIQPEIDRKVKGAKLQEAHAAMRQLQNSITSEEYVAHLLRKKSDQSEWRPMKIGGKALGGKIGREFRFAQSREIPTLAHAVAWGLKPPSLNAFTAFTIHGDEFATARATHMLIEQLRGSGIGKWGAKTGEGGIPEGWTEIAPHAQLFQQMRAFADPATGEPTLARQTLWVPRYIEEALRPITDPDYTSRIAGFRKMRMWQAVTKSAELGLSLFHLKSENMMALANMGPRGWLKAQMADRAGAAFLEAERDMVLHGGTSPIQGKTVEAYKGIDQSSIPSRAEILVHAPLIKQLNAGAVKLSEFIFDNQMRRFKVINYSLRKAAWIANHPNATPAEMSTAMHSIASELNAVYGGVNWENLGVNKATVEVARAIMLAPDWTISNFFNVRTVAEGGWKGSEGAKMARMFWLRAIIGGLAATQGASLLFSGHASKRSTMVYLGKDDQGREIYQNLFFAGAPSDVVNLVNNVEDDGAVIGLAKSLAGKEAPALRTATELLTNEDFLGRKILQPGLNPLASTGRGAWEAAKGVAPIPFSFTNLAEMLHGTDEQQFEAREIITTLLFGQPPRHLAPEGTHMTRHGLRPLKQRAQHSFWQQLMTGRP